MGLPGVTISGQTGQSLPARSIPLPALSSTFVRAQGLSLGSELGLRRKNRLRYNHGLVDNSGRWQMLEIQLKEAPIGVRLCLSPTARLLRVRMLWRPWQHIDPHHQWELEVQTPTSASFNPLIYLPVSFLNSPYA